MPADRPDLEAPPAGCFAGGRKFVRCRHRACSERYFLLGTCAGAADAALFSKPIDPIPRAMTDEPSERPKPHELARQNRLRNALRDNLKRRKSQSRGRADQNADIPSPGADGPRNVNSRQDEPDPKA